MRRDVFQAIADPTRRDILDLLTDKPLTLNGLVENFNISRPAISKHVKILQECGLIAVEQRGRERHCLLNPDKLKEVAAWTEKYRHFWSDKLDALANFLDRENNK